MVMMVVPVMLREQILTGLGQLTLMFMQALADAPWTRARITTERLHVVAARLLPRGHLGLHVVQVLLAGSGQLTGMLLETGRKRTGSGRQIRTERLQTIAESARTRGYIGTQRLQVLTTRPCATGTVCESRCPGEREGERRDEDGEA